MDQACEVRGMHHTLFGQNQPEDMKAQEFQKPEYFLVVLLRAYESREEILHTHADCIRVLPASVKALYYEILSQVIF
jgi:hypothetical protein